MKKLVMFISALTALLILVSASVPAVFAEGELIAPAPSASGKVASYSSPALCADVGEKVVFAGCSVQFEAGADAISGDKITWKIDGNEVTDFTPAAAGVTAVTATSDKLTRTVYVVAKNADSAEYVLYETDFSADPSSEFRVIQQTSGTKAYYDAAAGTYVLDASNDGNGYVRVLLPAFLDAFGDAIYDAKLMLSNPKGSTARFGAMIYRLHNNDYPYMQVAMRYDSTASNGVEIAQRTEADKWNVTQKTSAAATKDKMTDIHVDFCGAVTEYSVNGKKVLTENATPYAEGAMGLHVRGVKMTVDSLKVTVNPKASADNNAPGGYAELAEVDSNLINTPVTVVEINSKEQLDTISENAPDVAIFTYSVIEGVSQIVLGFDANGIVGASLDEVIAALDGKIMPAFRVAGSEAALSLAAYLKEKDYEDAFVVSDDAAFIKTAYANWNYLRGVLDCASYSGSDFEGIRQSAVDARARIIIAPAYSLTKENVRYLEDKYMSVWTTVGENEADNVAAINCGVMGLVTENVALTKECFTKFYAKNTMTLTPNIIGHRGVPSLAQENSIAGCVKAFEVGADMVENDIYLSADNVLVVMHDSTIDRTTNGTGSITSMTTAQLKKFVIDVNANVPTEPIPTLEDYFKTFKGNGKTIVIELKSSNTNVAKPLADLVKKYDIMDQIVVISFHPEVIKAVRNYLPGVPGAYLNSAIVPDEARADELTRQLMTTLQTYNVVYSPSYASGALGEKLVNSLFRRGVTTWIWTVNKQADFDRYFMMGIRGMTTNYSQWASDYVREIGVSAADGKFTVTAKKYIGTTADVTSSAKLVVVNDGGLGVGFDAAAGKITYDEKTEGTAKFFFTYEAKVSSGAKYTLVSEVFTIKSEGVKTETTPESVETSAPAETSSATVDTSAVAPADTTEPESTDDKGCGSVCGPAITAAIAGITVAVVVATKKERD